LKLCSESFARISGGSLFQNIGPATVLTATTLLVAQTSWSFAVHHI